MDSTVVSDAARGTLTGTMPFPGVVRRLMETGVEYYHVDYVALRKTCEGPGLVDTGGGEIMSL